MKAYFLPPCLVILGMLAGCATTPSYVPSDAPEMAVVQDFAPFYSRGPQQIQGPDASLRLGDRVLLLRKEMGYSLVQLADSRSGYVPNEAISVPPAPSPQAAKPKPNSSSQRSAPKPPPEPIPDLEEEVLPDFRVLPEEFPPAILLDETEEPAKPDFRL
jgi:hypothetical protein